MVPGSQHHTALPPPVGLFRFCGRRRKPAIAFVWDTCSPAVFLVPYKLTCPASCGAFCHQGLFKALINYAIETFVRSPCELEPSEGVEPPSSTYEVDALPLSYVGTTD
jgi:hypothetical protein